MMDNSNNFGSDFYPAKYKVENFANLELFQNGFRMTFSEKGMQFVNVVLIILLLTVGTYYLVQLIIFLGVRIFDLAQESYKDYKVSLKKENKSLSPKRNLAESIESKVESTLNVAKKRPGRKKKVLA